jgi:hypothetical protein
MALDSIKPITGRGSPASVARRHGGPPPRYPQRCSANCFRSEHFSRSRARQCFKLVRQIGTSRSGAPAHGAVLFQLRADHERPDPPGSGAAARVPPGAPVPRDGRTTGACPGYVIDHVVPLKRGRADAPSNMQWQTTGEAKAKDRWSRSVEAHPGVYEESPGADSPAYSNSSDQCGSKSHIRHSRRHLLHRYQ